jgi:hypothetical protein
MKREWLAVLLPLAAAVAPYFAFPGGFIHPEAKAYLIHYNDHRSFLAKIFDPNYNDNGLYQARELSYTFDWLDAQAIDAGIRAGYPEFFPVSHALGILFIAVVEIECARRKKTGVGVAGACLLVAIFLTDPVVFISAGCYVRSAKVIVAAAFLGFLHFLEDLVLGEDPPPPSAGSGSIARYGGGACALAMTLSLLDRQGFFFAITAIPLLAALALSTARADPSRRALALAACGCAAAVVAAIAYDVVLAPLLIRALNGIEADFFYQRLPVLEVVYRPTHLAEGGRWLFEQASFFVGGSSAIRGGTFLLAAVAALALVARERAKAAAVALSSLAAFLLMFAIMIFRHPPLLWDDVKRGYYGIPFAVFLLFGVTLAAGRARVHLGRRSRLVELGLGVWLAANVAALPEHVRIATTADSAEDRKVSDEIRKLLAERRVEPPPAWANSHTRALLEHYARVFRDDETRH